MEKIDLSIEQILPHRAPMILVSAVEDFSIDDESLTASAIFDETSIFYDAQLGGVPAYVGIELMAQTVALLSGIFDMKILGQKPRIGFLLGARSYKNHIAKFELGRKYFITTKQVFMQAGLGVFSAKIVDENSVPVAETEINVYRTQDDNFEDSLKGF